jgi:hypothetical protein
MDKPAHAVSNPGPVDLGVGLVALAQGSDGPGQH